MDRFKGFIQIINESSDEVELKRYLSPNQENSILQAPLPTVKPPFEIELRLQFPESEEMELFNFSVDKHGELSWW